MTSYKSLYNFIKSKVEYIIFFILLAVLVFLIARKTMDGFYNAEHGINRLDAIIYINLENRQDRKDLLMKELETLNTNMKKVHKVSGVYIPKNGHKGCVQSHIIALNMIKMNKWDRVLILEDDAQLDVSPEIFNQLLDETLDYLDASKPNWDVLMLASANKVIKDEDKPHSKELEIVTSSNTSSNNSKKNNKNNSNSKKHNNSKKNNNSNNKNKEVARELKQTFKIEKLHTATTASAYIVKNAYADKILELFNTCNNNMEHSKLSGNNFENWALDQKWFDIQMKDNWYVLSPDPIKQRAIWSTTMSESHT
jgi:GR25 family glycosyltransferase involved in LPS biosynthesis